MESEFEVKLLGKFDELYDMLAEYMEYTDKEGTLTAKKEGALEFSLDSIRAAEYTVKELLSVGK